MTLHASLSRRTLLRRAAVATLAAGTIVPTTQSVRSVSAQNGDIEMVCISDDVRLRDNPTLSSNILALLYTGDVVNQIGSSVNADGYTWIPISLQRDRNLTGWAASEFFQSGGTPGWVAGTPIHVTSDNVNLRSGAGLGYGVIATYFVNNNATVIGGPQSADGYSWYNISIGGNQGWMASDFLAEGHTGDTPGFPAGAWVWTTSDVNLRSGPGTGNGVIATYGARSAAYVISGPQAANGYSWYQLEMADDGNVGWMAGEFLEYAPTEPTGGRYEVIDGPLNLRSQPSTNGGIVTSLATGSVVVIMDASFVQSNGYTWANVYVESNPAVSGWVATDFIAEI